MFEFINRDADNSNENGFDFSDQNSYENDSDSKVNESDQKKEPKTTDDYKNQNPNDIVQDKTDDFENDIDNESDDISSDQTDDFVENDIDNESDDISSDQTDDFVENDIDNESEDVSDTYELDIDDESNDEENDVETENPTKTSETIDAKSDEFTTWEFGKDEFIKSNANPINESNQPQNVNSVSDVNENKSTPKEDFDVPIKPKIDSKISNKKMNLFFILFAIFVVGVALLITYL